MLLLYLDDYHLGDPLFLTRLARDVQAFTEPLLLVHGSGDDVERALEATGEEIERAGGRLQPTTEAGRRLVERSLRDLNRRLVHTLNDAGVAALRILGSDRGLLRRGQNDQLEAGRVGWVAALMLQRVVPVVGLLVAAEDGDREVGPAEALAALAGALADEVPGREVQVGLLLRQAVPPDGLEVQRLDPVDARDAVPALARMLQDRSVRLRMFGPAGLRS